jgi:membrane protein implicated in regulation of membrane protease activity
MTNLFLASFIGGLLLAVQIMIAGVERPRTEHPAGERTFRLSPPLISAFAVVFGIAGYVMARRQVGTVVTQLAVAGILGAMMAVITARLVRDWWKVTPEHESDDERFVLQGHVAQVTKPIGAGVDGEVAYEHEGKRHVHRARGLDDTSLAAGSEVVIERIEDDIAYVESWTEVEKRL